jgi:hypothetical protein
MESTKKAIKNKKKKQQWTIDPRFLTQGRQRYMSNIIGDSEARKHMLH